MMPVGVRQPRAKDYAGDIPFDSKGNQQHYPEVWAGHDCKWKPNFRFHGRLIFLGFLRGRSAAYASFARLENGQQRGRVTVFLKDLEAFIVHPGWKGGIIEAEFTFCKRGQNYGCKVVQ